ncbi:MAG: hypothetical protein WAV04_00495 [Candidatus Microsaccharimonas sp.]
MPGVREAYVTDLAEFCQVMFTGTECYFGAHAKIEMAVLAEGSLDDAIALLKRGEDYFEDAKSKIGSVASLYEQLGGTDVDFGAQLENLAAAATSVSTARMELELLGEDGSVQDKLWEQSALTDNFVAATEAVMATMAWQSSFAKSRVAVAV